MSEIRIPGIDADPEAMEMLKEHLIEMSLRPKDDFDLDDLSASEIEDTEIERPTEDSKDCDEQGPVDNIPGMIFASRLLPWLTII